MFELSSYEIIKKLATGGMAEIYLARHRSTEGFQRNLVLKRILPEYSDDPTFVQSFLDEARLAGQLTHPNIVQIYDLGKVGKAYFIAMEYIRGFDLHALLRLHRKRKTPLPLSVALRVFCDMCAGLDYAHHATDVEGKPLSIVHRDVTPSNVLVSMDGHSKVVDFGIAKATALGENKTKTGTIKGKFAYLAPEQVMGHAIDRRVDVWAAGIVLHELLLLRNPFRGDTEYHTLQNIVTARLQSVCEQRPELPAVFDQIVFRALNRELDQRFATTGDLMRAVEAAATQHAINLGYGEVANYLKENEAALEEQREHDRDADKLSGSQSDIVPGSKFSLTNTQVDVAPQVAELDTHTATFGANAKPRGRTAVLDPLDGDSPEGATVLAQTPILLTDLKTVSPQAQTLPQTQTSPQAGASGALGSPASPSAIQVGTTPAGVSSQDVQNNKRRVLIAMASIAFVLALGGGWLSGQLGGTDQAAQVVVPSFAPAAPLSPEPTSPELGSQPTTSAPVPPEPVVKAEPPQAEPTSAPPESDSDATPAMQKGKPLAKSKRGKGATLPPGKKATPMSTPKSTPSEATTSAGAAEKPAKSQGSGPGRLRVVVSPWATVEIDGRRIGDTPIPSQSLAPGSHTVVLSNDELNKRIERRITIEPGHELILREQFQ